VEACIAGAKARQAEIGGEQLGLQAIMVEKPLCEDLESAMRLVDIAESAGVRILVGHQRRHSAFVQKARALVQDANFGPLRGFTAEFALLKPDSYYDTRFAWRSQKGKGGPLLINLVHDVDLFRYITGHEVNTVFAATSSSARGFDVEDTGAVTMVLDHGAVGTCFFSDAAPAPWSYEFTTQENKKYAALPGKSPSDCYHFMGAQRSLAFPSLRCWRYGEEVHEAGWDASLSLEEAEVQRRDPIVRQMEHFIAVCRNEAQPVCSGRDAIQTLAVIEAVIRSAERQVPVCPGELLQAARMHRDDIDTAKGLVRSVTLDQMPPIDGPNTLRSTDVGDSASEGKGGSLPSC